FANAPSPAGAATSGDIYMDLATGQRGVCRHRAFAFVVTAQALGLPARFVSNEVHAFVEVHVPHLGWRRVDLGGAALDLPRRMTREARGRPRARADDPFPQPPSYRSGSASSRVAPTVTNPFESASSGAGEASEAGPADGLEPPDGRAPTHVE